MAANTGRIGNSPRPRNLWVSSWLRKASPAHAAEVDRRFRRPRKPQVFLTVTSCALQLQFGMPPNACPIYQIRGPSGNAAVGRHRHCLPSKWSQGRAAHLAARRSAPLTPRRGKYAGPWLWTRHLSGYSHGKPSCGPAAEAGGSTLVSRGGQLA